MSAGQTPRLLDILARERQRPPEAAPLGAGSAAEITAFAAATPHMHDFTAAEHGAFREVILAALPRLRAYAISLLGSAADADDLVQETLFRAWRAQATFTPGTNQDAWMFRILRNEFYRQGEYRRRFVADPDSEIAGGIAFLPDQLAHLEAQDLQRAVARLPTLDREALLMVVAAGMSYETAAAACECQVSAMKQRVWRARRKLMSLIDMDKRRARRPAKVRHAVA